MPTKPQPDRFLNIKEVAALIGLSEKTIRSGGAGTEDIPRIKLGGRVLFSFNAVQKWMAVKAREAEEEKRRRRLWAEYHSKEAVRRRCQQAVENTLKTIVAMHGGRWYERRK